MRLTHVDDVIVKVVGNRKTGLWGSTTLRRGTGERRTAGRLNTHSTNHTLQTVALVTSLKAISRNDVTRLLQGSDKAKPRLVIAAQDATFVDALQQFIGQKVATKPIRAAKGLHDVLRRQLDRFDVTVRSPENTDFSIMGLYAWAAKTVLSPIQLDGIPPSLAPLAISA